MWYSIWYRFSGISPPSPILPVYTNFFGIIWYNFVFWYTYTKCEYSRPMKKKLYQVSIPVYTKRDARGGRGQRPAPSRTPDALLSKPCHTHTHAHRHKHRRHTQAQRHTQAHRHTVVRLTQSSGKRAGPTPLQRSLHQVELLAPSDPLQLHALPHAHTRTQST